MGRLRARGVRNCWEVGAQWEEDVSRFESQHDWRNGDEHHGHGQNGESTQLAFWMVMMAVRAGVVLPSNPSEKPASEVEKV